MVSSSGLKKDPELLRCHKYHYSHKQKTISPETKTRGEYIEPRVMENLFSFGNPAVP